MTIRLSIDQIVKYHGERIWYAANCAKVGIWDADDIYQQLVILIHEHSFKKQKTLCRQSGKILAWNPSHVNRFLQSRALDFRRNEHRRRTSDDAVLVFHPAIVETPVDRSERLNREESAHDVLADVIASINDLERKVLELLIDPNDDLIALAQRDRDKALKERECGALKMNIHGDLVVLKRHIAEYLGVSPATVCRAVKHTRELAGSIQDKRTEMAKWAQLARLEAAAG